MKLVLLDMIVVYGDAEQLAKFAVLFLLCMKSVDDKKKAEEAKKEAMAIAKAMNLGFEEMIKQERDDGK